MIYKVLNKFNTKFALGLTLGVSSIWAFYVFVIFGLAPLIWPRYEENILYWSNFLQLIFLPVITVGSNLLGRKAAEQAVEDHTHISSELDIIKANHDLLMDFSKQIKARQDETSVIMQQMKNSLDELQKILIEEKQNN